MLNELEDNIMKKLLIKIFVVAAAFIVMNTSLYSIPLEQLGNFQRADMIGYNVIEGRWVTIFYFQFGMVTRGFGDDIIYLYGQEDLPGGGSGGWGKGNIENFANINEDIHVYVYEANNIANPHPTKHKIVNGEVDFKLQNLNLHLEKGKLYFIVFCDGKGAVLHVKKLILAE
jgi:hypothetical protein